MKARQFIISCVGSILLLSGTVLARSDYSSASIKIAPPTNKDEDGTVDISVEFWDGKRSMNNIPIPRGSDRLDKMNAIKKALKDKFGLPADNWNANYDAGGFDFKCRPKKQWGVKNPVITLTPKNTGENPDSIKLAMATFNSDDGTAYASASFGAGSFTATDSSGNPSIFSCGFTTDVGTYVAQVSSVELAGQLDGPSICAALWARLIPVAPAYGVSIANGGSSLEMTYDTASVQTDAGVTFGTSSLTPGVVGEMGFIPVPEPTSLATLMTTSMFMLRRRRCGDVAKLH